MLDREYGPDWVRIQESTLIQNLKLNHKIEVQVHIRVQVQFIEMITCQFVKDWIIVKFKIV